MVRLPSALKKITPRRKKVAHRTLETKRSFRLSRKRERPVNVPQLPTMRQLVKETLQFMKEEWKVLAWLGVLYALSYRILVEGLLNLDLQAFKQELQANGVENKLVEMSALTANAFGATGNTPSAQSGTFAGLLTIIFGLAVIWTVRKRLAGHEVRVRDALYNCAAPLIPVLCILFIIFFQLLPMAIGWFLYVVATSGGIVVNGVENMALFLVALGATVLSCYWLSSSVIALVAVTVPGMYPLTAMRGAKELVSYRRWHIFMRVLSFAIVATIFSIVVVMLTVSNFVTQFFAAEIVDLLRGFVMVVSIVALYKLYRTLVDETAV